MPLFRVVLFGVVLMFAGRTVIQAEDELWKKCFTPTTHFVLQVPGSLVRQTGPEVTGCTYQSQDGEFHVEAVEEAGNQTLDARMQKEVDLLKGTVSDQKKGENWFALTGVTSDGTEYYRLHHTNGMQWVTLRITFPRSKAKQYDKWVTRIDKEFVPFQAGAQGAAVRTQKQQEKPATPNNAQLNSSPQSSPEE